MVQRLMEAVGQAGIFMICAQVLIYFRPDGSYEKYMKLLASAMVMVQLLFPVMNFFLKDGQRMEERVAWFEGQMQERMEEAARQAEESEKILERMTVEKLRGLLEKEEEQEEQKEQGEQKEQKEQDGQEEQDGQSETVLDEKGKEVRRDGLRKVEKIEIEIGE